MNINYFVLFIILVLGAIYLLFQPIDVKLSPHKEIAQLELNQFVVHEYDTVRLNIVLSGNEGKRYGDRYEIKDVNFTNNTDDYVENMTSDYGLYKGTLITLRRNVHYRRNDGSNFIAEHVVYDENRSQARTIGPFKLWKGHDSIEGNDLHYNSQSGETSAKTITGIYLLKESM
ncbi:MAG: hypothetical protein DRG24_04890 [Epsilonproteobacteria bacterium]|nr:MAG: hypothetical protein DRG24_04890 [Campylobacterota bacterium]